MLSKVHLTLRYSAISCAHGVQKTCTPSALPVYFSSDSTVVQTIYFDSYGLPPLKDHVLPFIQNNSLGWIENTQMLQDVTSEVCGLYCIYVLYELNRGSSLQNILSNFSKDNLIKNDNDVLLWFSRKKYY